MSAYIFQIQSILIVLLLIYGITKHKNRALHIKLMSIAVIWDILLILQIELNRNAIVKAASSMTGTLENIGSKLMLNIHVSIAITTVVLYFVQIYLGRTSIKKERKDLLDRHKLLGYLTMTMRVLTLVTSFFIV